LDLFPPLATRVSSTVARRAFSTHALDAALSARAERLEIQRQAVLEKVVRTLRTEAGRLGITEAYIVGSLTKKGEWTDDSDVDVAVLGANPLEVMKAVEAGECYNLRHLTRSA
jgi:predicted nucleotidyltransferase